MASSPAYLPHLAYDSVVFGFSGQKLKILVIEYHNTGLFALPGGFVQQGENLSAAVARGLRERTGLDNIYLEQFYTFGDTARHQPEVMQAILKATDNEGLHTQWLLERFVSVAYYALIDYQKVTLKPDALSDSIGWYDLDDLPPLILDHQEMVSRALETLRNNLDRTLAGFNLLPARFTMGELQQVYEAILNEPIRRSSFQRKMLSLGILKRHEKRFNGKAHKAPYLYSFSPRKARSNARARA